ncbi:alpha/beta fold hydrolase [Aquisphaera insulae]|uniref:alpha/beta fold hydrolase n=1 Tax=Aquisphaera insulae TaxID=2712864 RepID=UPI00202FEC57|nr:alpha/beta fold hydrolase [Aquisphaera insulae]
MTDSGMLHRSLRTSDGYDVHVGAWPASGVARGHVVVLHGVQSHSGWYGALGSTLAAAGYHASFPDRRGSGPNTADRGHAPSARRLVADLAEWLRVLRSEAPGIPVTMGGISWGGKLALIVAAKHPELVDGLALICPGLLPRIGVSLGEKLRIAAAMVTDRHRKFPIPLSDPALFTANPAAQAFIASDPLGLREGTAGLMATSFFIDRRVRRAPRSIRQPVLLMLAGQDRIVDNARTVRYFNRLAATDRTVIEYPEAHHTLEFEADPSRYARDLIDWIGTHVGPQSSTPVG